MLPARSKPPRFLKVMRSPPRYNLTTPNDVLKCYEMIPPLSLHPAFRRYRAMILREDTGAPKPGRAHKRHTLQRKGHLPGKAWEHLGQRLLNAHIKFTTQEEEHAWCDKELEAIERVKEIFVRLGVDCLARRRKSWLASSESEMEESSREHEGEGSEICD